MGRGEKFTEICEEISSQIFGIPLVRSYIDRVTMVRPGWALRLPSQDVGNIPRYSKDLHIEHHKYTSHKIEDMASTIA